MDFPIDILDLPGAVVDASWNGIPFYMPDSRHQVGRRVQKFLFPGVDVPMFQDIGAFDGPMRVTGLLIGDLYASYARLLENALRTAGPGTLVHPWLGELQMILIAPAEITFSQKSLRVVRFTATFAWYVPLDLQEESTLDALLDDVAGAILAVESFVSQALAPLETALWLGGIVEGWISAATGYWQSVTGASPGGTFGAAGNPQLAAAVAGPITALGATSPTAGGSAVASAIAAVPAAIAGASATLQPPAVGPGDAAATTAPIDGRVTMAILTSAAANAQAQFGAPGLTAALALAQAALCALDAIQAASTIAWTSAQEAQAALTALLVVLDAAAAQAAVSAVPTVGTTVTATQAGLLWTALQLARADLIADMTATIGRLPQVQTVRLARPLPAWIVANILAGDNPALIGATYSDVIARNRVRNPALVPSGAIEVLAPASLPALMPGAAA